MAMSKINRQQEETWTGLHRRLTSIDFDLGSVFCDQVASFLENSAKTISSCTGYALSCLLTTCGFISARKTLIKMPNGHTQNSNIFQLVVGPPSTGKSQALKKFCLDPIKTMAEDLDVPDPVIHKSTLSGLTRKLSENKEGFFVSAEIFDSLARLFKPDNDTNDSALLCELFSGEQVSFNYATKSTTNISSTIPFSILGCIQMFPMAKLFVLLNQGQGLLDRFLLNVPLCLRPTPQESQTARIYLEGLANNPDFDTIMSAINSALDSIQLFSFSEEAAVFLEEMETDFITEMNEAIKNGTLPPKSKRVDMIARIALCIHVFSSVTMQLVDSAASLAPPDSKISMASLQGAVNYVNHCETQKEIFSQNPVTGLFRSSNDNGDAWVRDNVYAIMSVWGLAMAYRKQADLDEDRAKAYALEQDVVRSMRALLTSMMKQVSKVEQFKHSQSPMDSLHAKYNSKTGHTCVGDREWGHLQIDATSLFLLLLSQMTASGLQIVFTLEEVDFIQNLVFYIENAYRIADYGIWERGDKTNHGLPELNASSIGMAKAAMEAVNELDMFCARGGSASVIHIKSDKVAQCQAILHSMLPRESYSKEIDAGLLTVIGFPAFAVDDENILNHTREEIILKLQGKYGCRRFLRDGYKTVKEDPNRLYYDPAELKIFENIECEWPVFFIFLMIDGIFNNNKEQVGEYLEAIEDLMVIMPDGTKVIPELYYVPEEKVDLEYKTPSSQARSPGGRLPHLWSQSLYIIAMLLKEKFILPGELDPLNRRQAARPKPDLVVQVAVLAEDTVVQEILKVQDIYVQTVAEAAPVFIYPARVLVHIFKHLGENKKLKLSGNVCREIGVLSTSMLYTLHGKILAFVPQFLDHHQFYLALDNDLLADLTKNDIAFLRYNWRELGRPTVTITVTHGMIEDENVQSSILSNIRKFQTGYINGVQVEMKNLSELISTSCIKRLTFLEAEHPSDASLALVLGQSSSLDLQSSVLQPTLPAVKTLESSDDGASTPQSTSSIESGKRVHGIISRTRSIDIDTSHSSQTRRQSIVPPPPVVRRKISRQRRVSRDLFKEEVGAFRLLAETVSTKFSTPKLTTHMPAVTELGSSFERTYQKAKSLCAGDLSLEGRSGLLSPTSPTIDEEHFVLPEDSADSQILRKTASWMDTSELLELYSGQEDEQIIEQLKYCTSLSEQADLVHYLYESKGLDWNTSLNETSAVTVRNLMEELYYKSAKHRTWSLVRHTAGILQKRVEHLAQSVTDLLVRQKQVSVGLPPEPREQIITAPLPPDKLEEVIYSSCGEDRSCAVLTQELLIYLSLFIRTEPHLFNQMFRLRVGLIMQVMTSELARALNCDVDDAYEQLVTLSPYELKELLHHILSGREFGVQITSSKSSHGSSLMNRQPTIVSTPKEEVVAGLSILKRQATGGKRRSITRQPTSVKELFEDESISDRYGLWLRRRRVDGSLNRAPADFYHKVWKILERCPGLRIAERFLPQNLTREMTSNEFKFALEVETALNSVPQPEFRQLMVEALMVVATVIENGWISTFPKVVDVETLVFDANNLFLKDQAAYNGDAIDCCASTDPAFMRPTPLKCEGSAQICEHFYDSAPSGCYGTMVYMVKAAAAYFNIRQMFEGTDRIECKVS